MHTLSIATKQKKEVVPITEKIDQLLADGSAMNGVCHVFVTHTTAAVTTADLDPGTDLDMLDAFDEIIPKLDYRHPHNPSHVPSHILSALIGTSVTVPFTERKLMLGTWQEVVLFEFEGPRERSVIVVCIPESEEL